MVVKGGFYSGKTSYLSLSAILLRLRKKAMRGFVAIGEEDGVEGATKHPVIYRLNAE